jgi:hypothetical protein
MATRDNGEFTPNSNWIGDPNLPLKEFSWKKGVQPDTTGILMWNDVFLF